MERVVKTIPLTQGKVTQVDDEDFLRFGHFNWCATPKGRCWYAVRMAHGRIVKLHREILGAPTGTTVDHKNRDGLDNRRSNLRLATQSQQNGNTGKAPGKLSRFKGVTWNRRRGKWLAQIGDGASRMRYLGCAFTSEEEAARAYDRAATEKWGDFAGLNFP